MKKSMRFLAFALAMLMVASMVFTASAKIFPDVEKTDDEFTAVNILSELKVIYGYEDGTFKAEDPVKRQEMAAFLSRLATGMNLTGGSNTTPFTDLKNSAPYYAAITYCFDNKIIYGRSKTIFDPYGNITYQEAIAMAVRALGYEKSGMLSYPYGYFEVARTKGLLKGLDINDLTYVMTRGDIATLVYNALNANRFDKKTIYVNVAGVLLPQEVPMTFREDVFNFKTLNARIIGNERATTAAALAAAGNVTLRAVDSTGALTGAAYDVAFASLGLAGTSDLYLGHNITYYSKDEDAIMANAFTSGKTDVSSALTQKMSGTTAVDYTYTIGGKDYVFGAAAPAVAPNNFYMFEGALGLTGAKTLESLAAGAKKFPHTYYRMIMIDSDTNGTVDYFIYTPYKYADVVTKDSGVIAVANVDTLKKDGFTGYANFNSYTGGSAHALLYYNTDAKYIDIFEIVPEVKDVKFMINGGAGKFGFSDGKTYAIAPAADLYGAVVADFTNAQLGTTFSFAARGTVIYGNAFAAAPSTTPYTALKYAVITNVYATEYYWEGNTLKSRDRVELLTDDGKKTIVQLNKAYAADGTTAITLAAGDVGTLVSIVAATDGTVTVYKKIQGDSTDLTLGVRTATNLTYSATKKAYETTITIGGNPTLVTIFVNANSKILLGNGIGATNSAAPYADFPGASTWVGAKTMTNAMYVIHPMAGAAGTANFYELIYFYAETIPVPVVSPAQRLVLSGAPAVNPANSAVENLYSLFNTATGTTESVYCVTAGITAGTLATYDANARTLTAVTYSATDAVVTAKVNELYQISAHTNNTLPGPDFSVAEKFDYTLATNAIVVKYVNGAATLATAGAIEVDTAGTPTKKMDVVYDNTTHAISLVILKY